MTEQPGTRHHRDMNPDLQADVLVAAYAGGIFPMADEDGELVWLSPDPRAVLPLDEFRISDNLRRKVASRKFAVTVNQDFAGVIRACADRPDGTWISPDIIDAYQQLHRRGHAHSVEARLDGRLVGGLYGVSLGGAFFGESMFHRVTDASKVALVELVACLKQRGFVLLDVQFDTPHLSQFGVVPIPRSDYLRRLKFALTHRCRFADEP